MTNEYETNSSLDVSHGPVNYQIFDDEGRLKIEGPESFHEDWDATIRFHVHAESDEHEGAWGSAGFNLSREQAKELGEWLLEHYDDEATSILES